MTVKDLIKMDIDIDVCDDVCESLYIAFCGKLKLTKKGKRKFEKVLSLPVTIRDDIAIIHVDDNDEKVWKNNLKEAKEFFYAAAGYCLDRDYVAWFKEE